MTDVFDPTKLCLGCMSLLDAPGVCPHCGWDNSQRQNDLHQLPAGTILGGKYIVGRVLGQGGFGITYIGYDLTLRIRVAIKEFFPSGFAVREQGLTLAPFTGQKEVFYQESRDKFIQEARNLAKFYALPGIVSVKEYFRENNTAYIILEFIEGITLREYLEKNGRIPAAQALAMVQPLIRSLDQMHQAGIIHRDISPDNIMITNAGDIKLIDFGAARSFAAADERSMSILLKPGYAPEEQYRSHGQQGPWTDIYSLCATLYKLITGVTPPESLDRMREDTLQPPTIAAPGCGLTPAQERTLMRGMSIRQEDRYQNLSSLYAALYGTPMPVTTSSQSSSNQATTPSGFSQDSHTVPSSGGSAVPPPPQPPKPILSNGKLMGIVFGGLGAVALIVVLVALLLRPSSASIPPVLTPEPIATRAVSVPSPTVAEAETPAPAETEAPVIVPSEAPTEAPVETPPASAYSGTISIPDPVIFYPPSQATSTTGEDGSQEILVSNIGAEEVVNYLLILTYDDAFKASEVTETNPGLYFTLDQGTAQVTVYADASTLRFVIPAGVEVSWVNPPVTSRYLDNNGINYEDWFYLYGSEYDSYLSPAPNVRGNSIGNIQCLAFSAVEEGTLYFFDYTENGRLYKIAPGASAPTEVNSAGVFGYNLNALDGTLYFHVLGNEDDDPNVIASIDGATGSSKILYDEVSTYNLTAVRDEMSSQPGDYLYFREGSSSGPLYRMNTDGTGKTLIIEDSFYFLNVTSEYIYVADLGGETGIYRTDLLGENVEKLSDINAYGLIVHGEWAYFGTSTEAGAQMKRMNLDNPSTVETIGTVDAVYEFNTDGQYIYYVRDETHELYCMEIATGEATLLDDSNCLYPTVLSMPERNIHLLLYYNVDEDIAGTIDMNDIAAGPFPFFKGSDAQ